MSSHSTPSGHSHATAFGMAGVMIALGIVFGDIGTSPLYAYKAILGKNAITELLAYGGVSAVFWTLVFQTSIKYVLITLRADNNGEGGIFSLYTLIRRYKGWLLMPAIIGGSFLLADGIITPPISVASAMEGLVKIYPDFPVIPAVLGIIVFLFSIQQFGSAFIGKAFGPLMLVWFGMLAALGINSAIQTPEIFNALNPYWAYKMLVEQPQGFWLLGSVFLCTTGAEALYSDLGHCGRQNIQVSWWFVKASLVINYLGQGAWALRNIGKVTGEDSIFFALVPEWFYMPAIFIATLATIIASQALISGSFTLIAEAIRLNLWPKLQIKYPSSSRGQLYIPALNWMLMFGCIGVVLFFKKSEAMEAAYGMSVTITMLMTTILLTFYLYTKRVNTILLVLMAGIFLSIELSFLTANLTKFSHGGWVTFLIGLSLTCIMLIWYKAKKIKNSLTRYAEIKNYLPILKELSNDTTVPKFATNLIYLSSSNRKDHIEEKIMYSILQRQPKRADVYWFVHIEVVDDPYKMSYRVDVLEKEEVYRITFILGFRVPPRLNYLFRIVVEELVKNGEVNISSRYHSLMKQNIAGDFKFVVFDRFLSYDNELPFWNGLIMQSYFILKHMSTTEEKVYGLDYSSVLVEKVPLIVSPPKNIHLVKET